MNLLSRIVSRIVTIKEVMQHFVRAQKWFFVPFLLILLLAGLLLLATHGLSYVAPFVYTLF